jgi:LacI family transcriptional regulator
MPPPSLRSLARQLGISAATVSLALRDSAHVVPATKKRIVQAARRAGYRPNPLVGSLMAALRRTSHGSFQGSLIAVNASDDPRPSLTMYHRQVFDGARRRARELGYSIELCWVGAHALTLTRFDAVLRARGVRGVVVMPFIETRDLSAMDWSSFAAVMFDHCLSAPTLHSVLPDHQLSILDALERLTRRGYVRPGLVVGRARDSRVKHKWSAGFSSYCHGQRLESPVPVLSEEPITRESFLHWFRRYRPDVLIGHVHADIARWLREDRLEIPRDVGFVQLNWTERSAPCAGLDLQPALLGAAAVESVVAQLQRNEQGVPAHPKTITLAARWVEGPTIRRAAQTGRHQVANGAHHLQGRA